MHQHIQERPSHIAILTRPEGRNADVSGELSMAGWTVLECPLLAVQFDGVDDGRAIPSPEDFDLVIFTSRAAVTGYAKQLSPAYSWPDGCMIATVGSTTANFVREQFGASLNVVYPAGEQAESESLWVELLKLIPLPRRVLWVRGQEGRDWLVHRMTSEGISVTIHAVYRRTPRALQADTLAALESLAKANQSAVWLLTSAQSLESLFEQAHRANLLSWLSTCSFILTHDKFGSLLQRRLLGLNIASHDLDLTVCRPDDVSIIQSFLTRPNVPKITIAS